MDVITGIQEFLAPNIANVKNMTYPERILKHWVQTVKT